MASRSFSLPAGIRIFAAIADTVVAAILLLTLAGYSINGIITVASRENMIARLNTRLIELYEENANNEAEISGSIDALESLERTLRDALMGHSILNPATDAPIGAASSDREQALLAFIQAMENEMLNTGRTLDSSMTEFDSIITRLTQAQNAIGPETNCLLGLRNDAVWITETGEFNNHTLNSIRFSFRNRCITENSDDLRPPDCAGRGNDAPTGCLAFASIHSWAPSRQGSELLVFVIVIMCGGIGAVLNAIRQPTSTAGNVGWNLSVRDILSGAAAGFVVILTIKGGQALIFVDDGLSRQPINVYGIAFAGIVVGMFTQRAYELLSVVAGEFDRRFREAFLPPQSK